MNLEGLLLDIAYLIAYALEGWLYLLMALLVFLGLVYALTSIAQPLRRR